MFFVTTFREKKWKHLCVLFSLCSLMLENLIKQILESMQPPDSTRKIKLELAKMVLDAISKNTGVRV